MHSVVAVKQEKVEVHFLDYCPKMGGLESQCRPASKCAVWYDLVNDLSKSACKLANGAPGACCPDIPSNGIYYFFLLSKFNEK